MLPGVVDDSAGDMPKPKSDFAFLLSEVLNSAAELPPLKTFMSTGESC